MEIECSIQEKFMDQQVETEAARKARLAELDSRRQAAGLLIDPETAEIYWRHALVIGPYGDLDDVPEEAQCIGRVYFARRPNSDDDWICFYDLPDQTRDALWTRMDKASAAEPKQKPVENYWQ
jgi:hypothetical protein